MAHKFDPANKDNLDSDERRGFYSLPDLLNYFTISSGMIIADVGCGTGYCSFPMANIVGDNGKVLALDISSPMVEAVKEKISKWNTKNVIPLVSQENIFPLEEDSVDFIMLSLVVHELESAEIFFAEINRILKKDGSIGIVEWDKIEPPSGPPIAERVSADELKKNLEKNGMISVRSKRIGKYHYAMLVGREEEVRAKKIDKVSKTLVKELLCIREKEMRSIVLAERFNSSKVEVVVEILQEICSKASEKKEKYSEVMASCIDIDRFRKTLGLEKMSRIYNMAKEKEYVDVVRLLMNPSPKGAKTSEYDFVEGRDIFDITLGEKRSLSKSHLKDSIDRLLYDEDPTVIRNLLANPRVTERDILKIASKRPNSPEVIKVVFESNKWLSRYIVKRALLLNPYTPTGIALGLINFMQHKDLELIASDQKLHGEIITAAKELLKEKSHNY